MKTREAARQLLERYGLTELHKNARARVKAETKDARPRERWLSRKAKPWRQLALDAETQRYTLTFGSNGYGGLLAEGLPVRLHLPRRRLPYTAAYRVCIADPAALNVVQLPSGVRRFLLPDPTAKRAWITVPADAVAERWPSVRKLRALKESAGARARSKDR